MTPCPQHPAPRRTRFAAGWLASACLLALAGCALTPPEPEIAPRPGWQPPPVTFWRWGPPPPAPDRDVPPSYMVLLNNDDGTTGQVVMQSTRGKQVLNKAREAADIAGRFESLATQPAAMWAGSLGEEKARESGIAPGLIRFSVGLEHPQDLLADLSNALAAKD